MKKTLELKSVNLNDKKENFWKHEVIINKLIKKGVCVDCEAISGDKMSKDLILESKRVWGNNRNWEESEFRCLQCAKIFLNDWDFFNLFITKWARIDIKNPLDLEELRKEINDL